MFRLNAAATQDGHAKEETKPIQRSRKDTTDGLKPLHRLA